MSHFSPLEMRLLTLTKLSPPSFWIHAPGVMQAMDSQLKIFANTLNNFIVFVMSAFWWCALLMMLVCWSEKGRATRAIESSRCST